MSARERPNDDDDLGGDVPDDVPLPVVSDELPAPLDFDAPPSEPEPALPVVSEADPSPLDELDGLDTSEIPLSPEVIDWSTTTTLPDLGLRLPAILDPTAERTVWFTPRDAPPTRVLVRVGRVELRMTLQIESSDRESIRFGRDFLADRVWVRS